MVSTICPFGFSSSWLYWLKKKKDQLWSLNTHCKLFHLKNHDKMSCFRYHQSYSNHQIAFSLLVQKFFIQDLVYYSTNLLCNIMKQRKRKTKQGEQKNSFWCKKIVENLKKRFLTGSDPRTFKLWSPYDSIKLRWIFMKIMNI